MGAAPTNGRKLSAPKTGMSTITIRTLSWTLANFRCSETAVLQVFLMPAGIFARSRARPGPTKNSVYSYILGHFAHPPLRKLAKVQLRCPRRRRPSGPHLAFAPSAPDQRSAFDGDRSLRSPFVLWTGIW